MHRDRISVAYQALWLPNMWHDQGKWVTCRKFQFQFSYTTFSKLQNASFWCKPHLQLDIWLQSYAGFDSADYETKHYETKEFEHCFCQYLKNNIPDIRLIPLDHVTY